MTPVSVLGFETNRNVTNERTNEQFCHCCHLSINVILFSTFYFYISLYLWIHTHECTHTHATRKDTQSYGFMHCSVCTESKREGRQRERERETALCEGFSISISLDQFDGLVLNCCSYVSNLFLFILVVLFGFYRFNNKKKVHQMATTAVMTYLGM